MQIALKESKETKFWLRLIKDADVYRSEQSDTLLKEYNEIILIITSILKTAKANK